jgi:branched-chain amino acid transport system permease protein
MLLQQIINGISIGSVYAIFALGYTLIFSILGIINFAHGAIFTLGAYFTYAFMGLAFGFNGLLKQTQLPFGLGFWPAMLVGAFFAGLFGILLEYTFFRPLRARRADPLLTLVASLGLAVAIVNIIQYLAGAETYSYPTKNVLDPIGNVLRTTVPISLNLGTPGAPLIVRTAQVIIIVVSLIILAALTFFINRTKTGYALRAVAEDGVTANLLGINTNRLIRLTFFLSGFVGGIAGTLVGVSVGITGPSFGIAFGLRGLAVIVLGGLGSIPGAVIGGLVIGLAEALVPSNLIGYREAIAFAILFIVLLVRPQGLLGRPTIQKV